MSRTTTQLWPELLAATCFAAVFACQAEPDAPAEIRYETEHLRIGTTFDEPLCQGDLERYESWVARFESSLDVDMSQPVTAYLWATTDFPDGEVCREGVIGCYIRDTHTINSSLLAFDHELVHAVAAELGEPAPLFSEGLAEALSNQRTLNPGVSPAELIDLPREQLDYRAAGHFARWLWKAEGAEQFRELMQRSGDPRVAFESVYGMTIEAASEQYLVEVPYAYAPPVSCEDPILTEVGEGLWSEAITLDCDGPGTLGGPFGSGANRVLMVDAAATFDLSTSSDGLSISRCPDEDLAVPPVDGDPAWGDVPPVTQAFQDKYVLTLSGSGETHELVLAPGRYELQVFQTAHVTTVATIEVEQLL